MPRNKSPAPPRIRLRKGGRSGATFARNLGLKEATGECIQFLDADGYLEPIKIATQLRDGSREACLIYPSGVGTNKTGKRGSGPRFPVC